MWKISGSEKSEIGKWCALQRRKEESGEVEGCDQGGGGEVAGTQIGKMPEEMVGGHRLEIPHTFPKSRATI